jgi:hypothetical protein
MGPVYYVSVASWSYHSIYSGPDFQNLAYRATFKFFLNGLILKIVGKVKYKTYPTGTLLYQSATYLAVCKGPYKDYLPEVYRCLTCHRDYLNWSRLGVLGLRGFIDSLRSLLGHIVI